ncbi:MAG TPA: YbdD/YjiX family protein [Gemmatimonadaceae bacterium]|nr:YbdD/YjiX family protein [Gemmatimonadaceae bacterium]
MSTRELLRATHARLEQAACVVRRVIGVPDYDRYVAHVRTHHPDEKPMPRDEFMQQRLMDRYSRPGNRCC